MRYSQNSLWEALNLQDAGQVAHALAQLKKDFDKLKLPHPPMPLNVVTMAPCDLVITETQHENGSRTGHVKITHANGVVAHEEDFLVAGPQR